MDYDTAVCSVNMRIVLKSVRSSHIEGNPLAHVYESPVHADSSSKDIGMDSLKSVQLGQRLQRAKRCKSV